MLRKRNGFTVIELIMSFVFASILSITLFSVVINYRSKEIDTSIQTDLLAFKSKLIIDIEKDIQKYILESMEYCEDGSGNRINRCVDLKFSDGTVKRFQVKDQLHIDTLYDDDGNPYDFSYNVPYISYGNVAYQIPDAGNITIRSDYMLQSTTLYDGIESNTPIYKLRIYLVHNDLDTDMDISIVANGTKNLAVGATPYKTYNVGDRVSVQLNGTTQRYFRVIENSYGYNGTVTLLYDDVSLGNFQFAPSNGNNSYDASTIKVQVDSLKRDWKNVASMRLITSEEIGYIVKVSPRYRGYDVGNQSLGCATSLNYDWLISSSYWTMTGKLYSDKPANASNINKKVWYVNSGSKILTDDFITASHLLRPVIVVEKKYITTL